jgi:CDP-glucose 4,6-dehydratase
VLSNYKDKTVLVTGHTGFKGSWLSLWLTQLGARVIGFSLDVPTTPSLFNTAEVAKVLQDCRGDLRHQDVVRDVILETQPDFIFHLAAQPLVKRAYADPVSTYGTNVMGTIHVLEALRHIQKPCVALMITSDKCYDNIECVWGYRETDALGGGDPYSASKGAAEIVIRSYVKSYFNDPSGPVLVGVGRAGNVIGGGDWAADRIVPDGMRAWSKQEALQLRSPNATRPWQHVLEPLSGYLSLAVALKKNASLHGEPFNFGPPAHQNQAVIELIQEMSSYLPQLKWDDISDHHQGPHESGLLKLNCDKALHFLNWQAVLNFQQTVRFTSEWYRNYYQSSDCSMMALTIEQIVEYSEIAKEKGLAWAQ